MTDDIKPRAALLSAASDFLTSNSTISTSGGDVTGLPVTVAASIAWENKNFDTIGKNPWFSVFYRPNVPTGRTIGKGGQDELNGFIQIDFNVSPDSGESVLIDWEKKSRLYFHGGRAFTNDGHSVLVTSAGMSQGRHVENYFRKSLTVAFSSHLKRPQLT